MTNERQKGWIIEQFGSVSNYNKYMRDIASKGGKNSTSRPFKDPRIASKAGKASASNMTPEQRQARSQKANEAKAVKKQGWLKVEVERYIGGRE